MRVIEFGRAGKYHFLAMELVDGVDLRELIRTRERAPRQALEIVMQVCDDLQYAHDEAVKRMEPPPTRWSRTSRLEALANEPRPGIVGSVDPRYARSEHGGR